MKTNKDVLSWSHRNSQPYKNYTQNQARMLQCDSQDAKDIDKELGGAEKSNYNDCSSRLLSARASIQVLCTFHAHINLGGIKTNLAYCVTTLT